MAFTIAFFEKYLNNLSMVTPTKTLRKQNYCQSVYFLVCIGLFLAHMVSPLYAEAKRFATNHISITDKGTEFETIGSFTLELSSLTYHAINQGVPIKIVLSYANPKSGFLATNFKEISKTEYLLSRHSLSGYYELKNLATIRNQQFPTIEDALREISALQIHRFEKAQIDNNEIAVRIHLDIYNLPPQIRAKAFFSGRWRHDSDWSIWRLSK